MVISSVIECSSSRYGYCPSDRPHMVVDPPRDQEAEYKGITVHSATGSTVTNHGAMARTTVVRDWLLAAGEYRIERGGTTLRVGVGRECRGDGIPPPSPAHSSRTVDYSPQLRSWQCHTHSAAHCRRDDLRLVECCANGETGGRTVVNGSHYDVMEKQYDVMTKYDLSLFNDLRAYSSASNVRDPEHSVVDKQIF